MNESANTMMNHWMDEIRTMLTCSLNTGAKIMEKSTANCAKPMKMPTTFEDAQSCCNEKINNFGPVLRDNADVCSNAFSTQMNRNMDLMNDCCKQDKKEDKMNMCNMDRFQDLGKTGITAMRQNFETIADASIKMMENWTKFCGCSDDTCKTNAPTNAPKASKS